METPVSYLLTKEIAKRAIDMVRPAILAAVEGKILKRGDLHIVVMDPVKGPWNVEHEDEAILHEESFGDVAKWASPYGEIARAKAIESWRTGFPTHVIRETMPYLLYANDDYSDTVYWGSAVLQGLTVGVSGVQSWFDEWVAYMVAAACRALCIEAMQKLLKDKNRDFVWQPELDSHSGSR